MKRDRWGIKSSATVGSAARTRWWGLASRRETLLIAAIVVLVAPAAIQCTLDGSDASNGAADSEAVALPRTGQTESYKAGDDGDLQMGVSWPAPRFAENPDNTVTDGLTGLVWAQTANSPGPDVCGTIGQKMAWSEALDHVACLNAEAYLGFDDWRLPTRNELLSLINFAAVNVSTWLNTQQFVDVQTEGYWSSTTSGANYEEAWFMNMHFCFMMTRNKTDFDFWVFPVRLGLAGLVNLPRTGQTDSYAAGDDGDLQMGVLWPVPRFAQNSDNTVTDTLTGLIWTQDANAPGPVACANTAEEMTWTEALDHVACLNAETYLGFDDWRLPNAYELASLFHAGMDNSADWLTDEGFANVYASRYWTSTTYGPKSPDDTAWIVEGRGLMQGVDKRHDGRVWPVR